MYAVLDIESTGGQYNEEGIMEIAIYRFDGHDIVDRFISLVNPEREIQPFVAKLTGINNKMLRTAPKFHEVAKRIVEITEGAVIVAHNAQFDYRILRTEFRRLGFDFQRKTLCTVDLSKKILPDAESHSLGKLVRSLGIPMSDRHRANGDAMATLKLLKLLLDKDTDKTIIKEVVRAAEHGELSPNQLQMVSNLPSKTGVYYMHDRYGEIRFIGKTKDLQRRVNQHFTNTGELARKLQKETKKVTFELTGSELIAVLKEYAEVKKTRPRYNTIAKKSLFTHALNFEANGSGQIKLKLVKRNERSAKSIGFNGETSAEHFLARIAKEYKFDPLSQQNGAAQKTNAENGEPMATLETIYDQFGLGTKSIAIVDRGRDVGEKSFILIEKGELKGYGYTELNHQMNQLDILTALMTPMEHDENVKFIIESYLRKKNRFTIFALSEEVNR
ncbi:MAG: exonuclease domain-containing protein [Bacteroidota bacterium]